MGTCFWGMICIGKGLGLGCLFRSELSFGTLGHAGRLGGHRHTLGGGLGVLSSLACLWHVGQSCLRPFDPTLAPDIDTHNRWIMASQKGDKTERQDRKRRGERGVLAGLCTERAA